MNISFVTEPFASLGGCQRQIYNWMYELRNHPQFDVEFGFDLSRADIVHAFPVMNWHSFLPLARNRKKGVSFVLSTNYWHKRNFTWNTLRSALRTSFLSTLGSHVRLDFFGKLALLREADLVVTNTWAEADLLKTSYGILCDKFVHVPNSVDDLFFNSRENVFESPGEYLLTISSVDRRKNLHLVAAMAKKNQIPYKVFGPVLDRSYLEEIVLIGGKYFEYCGVLKHGSKEMLDVIDDSMMCCLPSWWETPGLFAMEAAVRGRKILVTAEGGAQEYFGEHAAYFLPSRGEQSFEACFIRGLEMKLNRTEYFKQTEGFSHRSAIRALTQLYSQIKAV